MKLRSFAVAVLVCAIAIAFQSGSRVFAAGSADLVISQVYGAGGNGGAAYLNDYIEIFNRGTSPVVLNGKSVQYASATGTGNFGANAVTALTGTLNPGQYYLIRQASGGSAGVALPTPDALGTVNMAAGAGKVALVNSTIGLACNGSTGQPCSAAQLALIIDLVGYGTGASGANFFEGTGQAPTINAASADFRANHGCTDTDNNSADFSAAVPAPRNTATAAAPCNASTNPGFSSIVASPSPVSRGSDLTIFATVSPGTNPISSGLSVTGNLSLLGGAATEPFFDNGAAPDVAAGDNVFTASVSVPLGTSIGPKSFSMSVTDAQSRSGNASSSVTVIDPPTIYVPHDIQGNGTTSLYAGQIVTVRGVVTARKTNGFFIQTQVGEEDLDPATSEGLQVFTSSAPTAAAAVGHLVEVRGLVAEFGDPGVTVTELSGSPTVFDLGTADVPAPHVLTSADLDSNGSADQLERFEGMRVHADSVTAVAGTDGAKSEANATSSSFGEVDVVLTGTPRPFREPGLQPGTGPFTCSSAPCNFTQWDGNPEIFRIDTNGIAGTSIRDVSSGAVFTDVTGPLDQAFGNYVVLSETHLEPVGGMIVVTQPPVAAPPAGAHQFTVASMNLERFYDDVNDPGGDTALTSTAYTNRLNKVSLQIRNALNLPDIIGVQEVEKLSVLQAIAAKVNSDASPSPGYVAYLEEGNDVGAIDVGFLVKTAGGRVTVANVEQVGLNATFTDPSDNSVDLLNDRPPLVLTATVHGPATALPQHLTVIVNHLRSLNDADATTNTGIRVRAKRQAQADFLANLIQGMQIADPAAAIVSVGDYNAFSFNDGLVDVMGTILGNPSPANEVVVAGNDLVEPNLVDVAEFIPAADRYSYVFDGSAQTLDHVIVSQAMAAQFVDLVHPRINADAAAIWRSDPNTVYRLSDHDPAVAYFTFPADTLAPVFDAAPDNVTAEATGPGGANVSFPIPTATDNLDASVVVTCSPGSGTLFPLGNTGVTCSTADAAGNDADVSFTVTVQDTTAPGLVLPAGVNAEATSAAGAVVTFAPVATDVVTAPPAVTCSPGSGSTFAIGTTTVDCVAVDAAGNSTTGSFIVTVTAPVFGRMKGAGQSDQTVFNFDVSQRVDYTEGGTLRVQFNAGQGKPQRLLTADVTTVTLIEPSTVTFSGTGTFNGVADCTFEVTAVDQGTPGPGHDTLSIVIKAPGGAILESIGGTIKAGNIQLVK